MKTCQQCGHQNNSDSKFCVSCGSDLLNAAQTKEDEKKDLVKICPKCGNQNIVDSKFCVNCGGDLQNSQPTQKRNIKQNTVQKEAQTQFVPNVQFSKKEKIVFRQISNELCPVGDLFLLSTNENEFRKTADYFEKWLTRFTRERLPKMRKFNAVDHWLKFKKNCAYGLLSFMVIDDYEGCLRNCDVLLGVENLVHIKAVSSRLTKETENKRVIYQYIRFLKAISLYELGRSQEAYDIIKFLDQNLYIDLKSDNEYVNQHLKYKYGFTVHDLIILINEA